MKFTEDLLEYIKESLEKYEDNLLKNKHVHGPFIVEPTRHLNPDSTRKPNVKDYTLPKIILWDPLNQLYCFRGNMFCPHDDHCEGRSVLYPLKWKDGRTDRDMPRQLYGTNGPVLLVSRVYRCSLGHEIVGHDARLLESIPPGDETFYLSHKMGITSDLCSLVFSLASSGQTFNEIEIFLAQRYVDNFSERQCRYATHISNFLRQNTAAKEGSLEQFPAFDVWRPTPSSDTVLQCFLYIYNEHKQFFMQHFSETSSESWISADHTFKVAANIGCNVPDGSWVTQFDSLFIVMNEKGHVMSYKLTKGTSIDNVTDILTSLKLRLEKRTHPFLPFLWITAAMFATNYNTYFPMLTSS